MAEVSDRSVSVVVPAYNQAAYLPEAIDSALAQSLPPLEVIVVDDGSTDDTPAIAMAYGDRVSYIRQPNRGLAAARNTGLDAARGNLVGLLDADDAWSSGYLASMVRLTDTHASASVYFCGVDYVDARGQPLPQNGAAIVPEPRAMLRTIARANFIIPSTGSVAPAGSARAGRLRHRVPPAPGLGTLDSPASSWPTHGGHARTPRSLPHSRGEPVH